MHSEKSTPATRRVARTFFACSLFAVPFIAASLFTAPLLAQDATVPTVSTATVPDSGAPNPDPGAGSSLPAAATYVNVSPAYRIGVDDMLSINVWKEPELSRTVPVIPDGTISLPLVGDVKAAGKTTVELQGELRLALSKFVKDPELTVMVADIRSRRVNVIGEVNHPGTFSLTQSMGVLDAIAEAGGLRDFAKKKDIYILRLNAKGQRERLPYSYEGVIRGKHDALEVMLRPHDTVVVP